MRLLPVGPEHVPAARPPDLFGHPVPDGERRVEPFDRHHADRRPPGIAPPGHALFDGAEPLPQRLDQIDRCVLHLGHRADRRDRMEDPLERGGLERDDRDIRVDATSDLVHLAIADGANVAQLLGQDEVGLGRRERLLIELIQRRTAVHRGRHAVVDVARRRVGEVVDAAGDDRLADDGRRPVTFMGDRDELILKPDGADDLGGRGEKGRDAHRGRRRKLPTSVANWRSRPEV